MIGVPVQPEARSLTDRALDALDSMLEESEPELYAAFRHAPIDRQLGALKRGVQVVVGTPGRILDHIRRRSLNLSTARFVVLDEADEMLDMGFIDDIEAILSETPKDRQTALFSATFPSRIRELSDRHLRDPERVAVRPQRLETPQVRQVAYIVPRPHKLEALARILDLEAPTSAIIRALRSSTVSCNAW